MKIWGKLKSFKNVCSVLHQFQSFLRFSYRQMHFTESRENENAKHIVRVRFNYGYFAYGKTVSAVRHLQKGWIVLQDKKKEKNGVVCILTLE